jgi:hypothetical protein
MNYLGVSTTFPSNSSSNNCILFCCDVTASFNINDEIYGYNNVDSAVRFGCVTGSTYSGGCTTLCTTQNFGTASQIIVRNLTTSSQCGRNSFMGGGSYNSASGYFAFTGAGFCNTTSGNIAFTGGGSCNTTSGYYAFTGSGICNTTSGSYAFIGNGRFNTSSGGSAFTGSGRYNTTSGYYSFTGGGRCNTTSGDSAFTGSGRYNIASSDYSGILGGKSNSTSTFCDSFIIGSCLTSDRACATFVNNLSIKNIPTSSAGLPAGSVWSNAGVLNIV